MITAPGAQPMFVDSAATLTVVGTGVGSVTRSPMRRWCSEASAWESTAQPPARSRALACATEPSRICEGGSSGRGFAGGAITHTLRSSPVQQATAVNAHRPHAGQPLRALPARWGRTARSAAGCMRPAARPRGR